MRYSPALLLLHARSPEPAIDFPRSLNLPHMLAEVKPPSPPKFRGRALVSGLPPPILPTDGRRGKGAPRTRPSSVRAAGTCDSVAGAAKTHGGVSRTSASPIGGFFPMLSPSEGIYPPGGFSNLFSVKPIC